MNQVDIKIVSEKENAGWYTWCGTLTFKSILNYTVRKVQKYGCERYFPASGSWVASGETGKGMRWWRDYQGASAMVVHFLRNKKGKSGGNTLHLTARPRVPEIIPWKFPCGPSTPSNHFSDLLPKVSFISSWSLFKRNHGGLPWRSSG